MRAPGGDRTRPPHGLGFANSVRDGDLDGVALQQLLDVAHDHVEGDAELLQDRPSLGRARCEDESQRSGKKIAASRAADAFESEPWTMFWPTSSAKSPRIEPGAASIGFVAPITWRAAFTAS